MTIAEAKKIIDAYEYKAVLDGERIPCRYRELYAFRVVSQDG